MRSRQRLAEFVRDGLRLGHTIDELRGSLERAGWSSAEVDAVLSEWIEDGLRLPVPRPRPSISGRDLVMFGLFSISLVVVIWHLVQLSFDLIDIWIADPNRREEAWHRSRIRWSISSLLVVLPLFVWLTYRIEVPSRGKSGPRRSPLQVRFAAVAVLLAILTLIGNAVAVVYAGLSGDLTAQFLAKAAVVAIVSGILIAWFRGNADEI